MLFPFMWCYRHRTPSAGLMFRPVVVMTWWCNWLTTCHKPLWQTIVGQWLLFTPVSNDHLSLPSRICIGLIVPCLNYESHIKVRLKASSGLRKVLAFVKYPCKDQQSWQQQQFNVPFGVKGLRELGSLMATNSRAPTISLTELFISKHFHDKQPLRELWKCSGLCNSMFRSFMKDEGSLQPHSVLGVYEKCTRQDSGSVLLR